MGSDRKFISCYTKARIHIYFQISSLFFTTLPTDRRTDRRTDGRTDIYKLLKREDQGLSPRKCYINKLKRYYTAVQNRVLVYASTLAFSCFISFWQ